MPSKLPLIRRLLAAIVVSAALSGAAASPASAGETPGSIVSLLKTGDKAAVCGRRESALRGTLARLAAMDIPIQGKLILVNIASRTLAAYDDGVPVVESRVVIGREGWHTPDLMTTVEYVRLNPTWTVPPSIVKSYRWREKLAYNPGWFSRNGFDVLLSGTKADPRDVDPDEVDRVTFVQRPGHANALGRLKIGLVNSGGIYLHDTNDPAAFDRRGIESHGCIRVESVFDLGAWVLGKSADDLEDMAEAGDKTNRKSPVPVRVVVGYFTAWPDAAGKVHYYRDIYGRDPQAAACSKTDADATESPYDTTVPMDHTEDRAQDHTEGPAKARTQERTWSAN